MIQPEIPMVDNQSVEENQTSVKKWVGLLVHPGDAEPYVKGGVLITFTFSPKETQSYSTIIKSRLGTALMPRPEACHGTSRDPL